MDAKGHGPIVGRLTAPKHKQGKICAPKDTVLPFELLERIASGSFVNWCTCPKRAANVVHTVPSTACLTEEVLVRDIPWGTGLLDPSSLCLHPAVTDACHVL